MSRKLRILLVFISLSLTLSLMSNTYSRYVADTTSNVEMQFASWQILVNENDITSSTTSSIELMPVMEENEHIANNTIAPSSKGYFDIDIDPTNVNVSFSYEVSLEVLNEDMPDLMITKYSILDSNYNEGDELKIETITDNSIKGTLNYNNDNQDFKYEPFTIRIYFEWYDGIDNQMDDQKDTEVGNKAAVENTQLQIKSNINFKQEIL